MKLAAIINLWDGAELLNGAIDRIKDDVDLIIIVYQNISNYGEEYYPLHDIEIPKGNWIGIEYRPAVGNGGFFNEKYKRNIGLDVARKNHCTHFLFLDTDEYYENFNRAKQEYIASGADGSVCRLFSYFKLPTLRFEREDNYFVPFIHKIHDNTIAAAGTYPYYVDPTRKVNTNDVALLNERMHHFTWVRKDIERKARNSSAKANIEKSQLLKDYHDPEIKAGSYVNDFRQNLIEVENIFNISI